MPEWNRADAEMAIALKRQEINKALGYRKAYDAEGHNLCLALINFTDGNWDVIGAYSDSAALPRSLLLGLGLIPDVSYAMDKRSRLGCNGMGLYHTEPKLLNWLTARPEIRVRAIEKIRLPTPRSMPLATYHAVLRAQKEDAIKAARRLPVVGSVGGDLVKFVDDVADITLVTEIDCCKTCEDYAIKEFRKRFPRIHLYKIELGKQVSAGIGPHYATVRVTLA